MCFKIVHEFNQIFWLSGFQTFTGTLSGAGFGRRVIDVLPDVFRHDFHLSSAYRAVLVSRMFVLILVLSAYHAVLVSRMFVLILVLSAYHAVLVSRMFVLILVSFCGTNNGCTRKTSQPWNLGSFHFFFEFCLNFLGKIWFSILWIPLIAKYSLYLTFLFIFQIVPRIQCWPDLRVQPMLLL